MPDPEFSLRDQLSRLRQQCKLIAEMDAPDPFAQRIDIRRPVLIDLLRRHDFADSAERLSVETASLESQWLRLTNEDSEAVRDGVRQSARNLDRLLRELLRVIPDGDAMDVADPGSLTLDEKFDAVEPVTRDSYGWHDVSENPPAEFHRVPLTGQKQQLARWILEEPAGSQLGRQLDNRISRDAGLWGRKIHRQKWEVYFLDIKRYAAANARRIRDADNEA